jgi:c-di-GMP-binding flagellar brake protein YcgR
MAGRQNRRFVRIKRQIPVEYKGCWIAPWKRSETRDISLEGIQFVAPRRMLKGTSLRLRIYLNGEAPIRYKAEVVGVEEHALERGCLISARFEGITADAVEDIGQYITSEMAKQRED